MKKIIFLLAALLASAAAFAQSDDTDFEFAGGASQKSHAFFVGPKIGGTFTTMTQPDECDLYDGFGFGLSGGVAALARFGRASDNSEGGTGLFGVGVELKFKQNKVNTIATDEKGNANASLSLGYFEVPVYLHLYPFTTSPAMNSFYAEAGLSFAGTVSRSPKTLTVDNTTNYNAPATITYNIDSNGAKLKGNDVRVLVGVGYTVPSTSLNVNARYYISTSKLATTFPCKMNTFEISFAWMFKAGML